MERERGRGAVRERDEQKKTDAAAPPLRAVGATANAGRAAGRQKEASCSAERVLAVGRRSLVLHSLTHTPAPAPMRWLPRGGGGRRLRLLPARGGEAGRPRGRKGCRPTAAARAAAAGGATAEQMAGARHHTLSTRAPHTHKGGLITKGRLIKGRTCVRCFRPRSIWFWRGVCVCGA
jgi:hypothetical protein